MTKIYFLTGSYGENCSFIEDYSSPKESIMAISTRWKWSPARDYKPINLELRRSDTGKRNYKFDFSSATSPFLIFSVHAANCLKDILGSRRQFLNIITDSKRKEFIGYYPTNLYSKGCLDLINSDYTEYSTGLLIRKPVLIKDKIPDEYLFTIEEDISRIFVTEKFKQLVEEHGLIGFEFSDYNEIEVK